MRNSPSAAAASYSDASAAVRIDELATCQPPQPVVRERALENLVLLCKNCPGSLHFINGIFESHRNRAPVVLIASQVSTNELGIDFPQEVEFEPVYRNCSVFCEMLHNPTEARRM